ncbi:hypothetical protein AVEN_3579-1 [Araneus ventricosus]|uniref:Uncharacterized protein n=1 Tax=Araneus ventricosus TaxID=182803 RepID=A0A4Y2UZY1_ARAVE|nr:hypothetical protein AVEN_3579-1 [Araneus ventricosus]
MLDSGSRRSLITESCWKKLGLKGRPTVHRIRGINNLVAETSFQEVRLEFTPHFDSEIFKVDALIVNRIASNLPNCRVNLQKTCYPHLERLKLADPEFYISSSVEFLIGADLYTDLIIGQSIKGGMGSRSAIDTRLGWILSGMVYAGSNSRIQKSVIGHVQVDFDLKGFWDLESSE